MKKFLFILVLILLIGGCGDNNMRNIEEEIDLVIASGDYIVLDVRTVDEYNEEHVVGAINIPYDEIGEDVIFDREKTILVYCRSGNRSSIAYDALKSLGYRVYDLGAISNIDLPKE